MRRNSEEPTIELAEKKKVRFSRKEARCELQQSSKIVKVHGIGVIGNCVADGSKRGLSYRAKSFTAFK